MFWLLAILLTWRGRPLGSSISGVVGTGLVVGGLFAPAWLRVPRAVWTRFAHGLAWINTRVLLTIAYAIAITPFGVWWRVIGSDPLGRRRQSRPGWAPYPIRYRDKKHYRRMY